MNNKKSFFASDFNSQEGFTMLEAIIAIFVVTVGILGVYSVTQQMVSDVSFSKNRLIAAYLAQEGIEIIRNIRDTNWIQKDTCFIAPPLYFCGLVTSLGFPFEWEVDHATTTLVGVDISFDGSTDDLCSDSNSNCDTYDGDFLKFDGNYYNYSSGNNTIFKRKVRIMNFGSYLEVVVDVNWIRKGDSYQVVARERLYNWKP